MKAWTYTTRGYPTQVLTLNHSLPQPQPTDLKAHEVLIKVSCVALFAPEAQLISVIPHLNSNPWIPGHDFSGTIMAVGGDGGSGGNVLKPGDPVFGMINPKKYLGYNGPLTEYMVAPRESVVLKPRNVKLDEASMLGACGCTAIGFAELAGWVEIVDNAQGDRPRIVNKAVGKRVLITGGSTVTGLFMLQLAKYLVGKEGVVVATCSPRNEEALRGLGVDETIDYTTHPVLHTYLKTHYSSSPFDTIIDITGTDPALYPKSPSYLTPTGTFAFAGAMTATHARVTPGVLGSLAFVARVLRQVASWQLNMIWPVVLGGVPRKCFFHSGSPSARNLELVRGLVEEGVLKGVVDSVWGMEDGLKAYEHLSTGKIRGKVVVSVQN